MGRVIIIAKKGVNHNGDPDKSQRVNSICC